MPAITDELIEENTKRNTRWYLSNEYGDKGFCISNTDHGVSVYVEPTEETWEPKYGTRTYTVYHVGLHDMTIAAHPTIPSSVHKEGSWGDALCRVFDLIDHLDDHIENMRESDEYQRALEVKDRAPPTREEGGVIPGFEVRNREGAVYRGVMGVQEAVEELRDIHRKRQ